MSPDLQRAQLVVLRLILIVLLGAAGTFGAVKLRDHNNHHAAHARACSAAEDRWVADDAPLPAGC